ncbi:TPA: 16S rRNA (uracil(1498)-N(3))-methyltransferase [Candidatus Poribacteria bacterium]|nr:16S rRNA (uracil(1498)-N(3))-methyltransferase [Candidatus Poribacteria bacterium]
MNVLRLELNEHVKIFDGFGNEYLAQLKHQNGDNVVAEILEHRQIPPPKPDVTLFQGLPKFDKFDTIVQKTTELSVSEIVPVLCQRSVPKLKRDASKKRVARWQRIANEASKQCGRIYLPKVKEIAEFNECLTSLDFDVSLILWEEERKLGLKSILRQNAHAERVSLFVGPEGGFSKEEVDIAIAAGAIPVTLGSNILRTETAAIVGVALILYELGGLGSI